MGCKQSRKKKNPNNTKHLKTKKRTRDIDQVHEDLKNPERFSNLPKDEDLPGEGQNYCVSCARYFQTSGALAAHLETKVHKRRLKMALDDPHTQETAEAAIGYSTARSLFCVEIYQLIAIHSSFTYSVAIYLTIHTE